MSSAKIAFGRRDQSRASFMVPLLSFLYFPAFICE
jgi:hypothetical protein